MRQANAPYHTDMDTPSPIAAMVAKLDRHLAEKSPPAMTPPNLTRLVRTIALLNVPPALCCIIAGIMAIGNHNAWPWFLGAAVLMVCWIKTIGVPHN